MTLLLCRMATPELCLLRFVVYDVDMFGEPNFLGHYTIPAKCALDGVRSVPLKNNFSEELELAGELLDTPLMKKENRLRLRVETAAGSK